MHLNDLLRRNGIDPLHVLVFRHRPPEPDLAKRLPWLAAERPDVFNAYQQTQGAKLEKVMQAMIGIGHVASFIGQEPGRATFVGLYAIRAARPLNRDEFWQVPANNELRKSSFEGLIAKDWASVLFFDLVPEDFYAHWKGKLVVEWPPPERSWWRRAHRNEMPVTAVHEESMFGKKMPPWEEIDLTREDLAVIPTSWKSALSQWRGIYYVFDTTDRKGYVGSAYGADNLLGRWQAYASSGHGGDHLLRQRDPRNFRFTILQRVSPDEDADEVVRVENTWKQRLHAREPYGLNCN